VADVAKVETAQASAAHTSVTHINKVQPRRTMPTFSNDFHVTSQALQLRVFERGWLSSNGALFQAEDNNCLVDTGYATHADQTVALVASALGTEPLHQVVNTHLHSDHCGGNAALSTRYPGLRISIPPGQSKAVERWDTEALSYRPTGQMCPRFAFSATLQPGQLIRLGLSEWEVHSAKGHDPHAVILYQPEHGVLLSADALWENGFGVVFPELDGIDAFDEVGGTLDLIESLAPRYVLPGHGTVFTDLPNALQRARTRLAQFQNDPAKHRRHAVKVLLKFKLLEWQQTNLVSLANWFKETAYFQTIAPFDGMDPSDQDSITQYLKSLVADLQKVGAATFDGNIIRNR